jgi:hypothetical protein
MWNNLTLAYSSKLENINVSSQIYATTDLFIQNIFTITNHYVNIYILKRFIADEKRLGALFFVNVM